MTISVGKGLVSGVGAGGAKKSSRLPRPHNSAWPMRHGNALTAKAWGDAVQGLVK